MAENNSPPSTGPAGAQPGGGASPAERALAEAEERRKTAASADREAPAEVNGPKGPEPTRYGDWEKGGIVSDF